MPDFHKLYTPQDSAVVFIDDQPQMTFGVADIERSLLINNVTLLAKAAKEFNVPVVLTGVETESFSGYVWQQLVDVFPGQLVVERSSMNAWDDAGFRKAIEATGRKNIILTGLWTEVCVTWGRRSRCSTRVIRSTSSRTVVGQRQSSPSRPRCHAWCRPERVGPARIFVSSIQTRTHREGMIRS